MREKIRIFFHRTRSANAHEPAMLQMYRAAVMKAEASKMSCIKLGLMKKAGEYLQEQIIQSAQLDNYKARLKASYITF